VVRSAFLFLIWVWVLSSYAQKKPVVTFAENDGLANDLVRAILLDSRDILWAGTDNGLSRYDGHRFINYTKRDGLPGNMVWDLAEGGKDSLYVACYTGGIALLHGGEVKRIWTYPDPLLRNTFRRLLYDRAARALIVGTDYGIYLLREDKFLRVQGYPYREDWKKNTVVSLKRYKGRIFFTIHGEGRGVYELMFDGKLPEKAKVRYLGPRSSMFALTFWEDTIYTNDKRGWYAIALAGGAPEKVISSEPGFLAWDMVTLPGGLVLAGGFQISNYDAVVRIYDIRARKFYRAPWMFQSNGIFRFCLDSLRKILWCGTENGLKALYNTPFSYYDLHIGTIEDLGWDGSALLILTREGVYRLEGDSARLLFSRETLKERLLEGSRYYHDRSGKPVKGLGNIRNVTLRYFIHDGDELYLNTNVGSLRMPDGKKYLPFPLGHFATIHDTSVYYILDYTPMRFFPNIREGFDSEEMGKVKDVADIRRKGDLLFMISYFNGMYAVRGKTVWNLNEQNSGVDNYMVSMDLDSRGNVWAVSPLGNLYWFDFSDSLYVRKKIDCCSSEINGMSYKWIKFMNGYLYLATNQGLNILPEEELWQGRIDTLWFYNRYNGYLDISTHHPEAADRGYFFVHTRNKLLRIGKPNKKNKRSEIRVQDLRVDGRTVRLECLDGHHFPPHTNNISITFYLLDYPADMNVEYRYRVNKGKWTATNMVSLSYLKPGRYDLVMEAKDLSRNKVYRQEVAFVIDAPLWVRWWMLLLMLVFLVLMIYGGLRFRYERLRRRDEERNRLLRESAELRIRALQIQMNPHFIFNALNTIQGAVMTKSKEETLDFIGDLSLVIRENLENVSKDYIPLSREIAFLQRYINVERFRVGDQLRVDFVVSVEDPEQLMVPPMLIQPLLENSIKHGVLPKKGRGEVEVRIDQEMEYLVVTIRDNGIGREQARANTRKKNHKSKGIQLLKERLEYLNQKNNTRAYRIEYEDLYEDGEPAGTVVRLYLQIVRKKDGP